MAEEKSCAASELARTGSRTLSACESNRRLYPGSVTGYWKQFAREARRVGNVCFVGAFVLDKATCSGSIGGAPCPNTVAGAVDQLDLSNIHADTRKFKLSLSQTGQSLLFALTRGPWARLCRMVDGPINLSLSPTLCIASHDVTAKK